MTPWGRARFRARMAWRDRDRSDDRYPVLTDLLGIHPAGGYSVPSWLLVYGSEGDWVTTRPGRAWPAVKALQRAHRHVSAAVRGGPAGG